MFGLSFLNAGSLFLLAAVAIPLLVHLLARRRPKRVVFSSLRFIRQVQQQQRRRLNLRQLILLILRTLVILLAILAIFRPVLAAPGLRKSNRHPRTAVAVIVDNSYSMDWLVDTRTALEHAVEHAMTFNAILSDNDMTLPLTRDRAWNRLNGRLRPGALPQDVFEGVALTPSAMPLDSLLIEAERLLAASDLPNREIYIFSDAQDEPTADIDTPWRIVPAGRSDSRGDLSCQHARLDQTLTERRLEQQVSFDVVNHGPSPQRDVLCQLVLDGKIAAETIVDLEPRQRLRAQMPLWLEEPGWRSGYVEVRNERLRYDNRAWLAFRYDLAPRIGVVTQRASAPMLLRAGLEVFADNSDLTLLSGDEPLDQLRGFDALIVYDAAWSTRLGFSLESLLEDGHGVLFIANRTLDDNWRGWLADRLHTRLEEWDASPRAVTRVSAHHPVMQPIAEESLTGVEATGLWRAAAEGAVSLFAADDAPLALDADGAYLWTFDVDAIDSPLLLDSAFPVLLYRTLQSLSGAEMADARIVGDRLYTAGQAVTPPDGERIELNAPTVVASQPGVWTIGAGDNAQRVAVDLDYAESDYSPMPADAPHLLPEDGWLDLTLPGRYGFETWKLLLAAALLLLAAEMLLVKRGERKAEN